MRPLDYREIAGKLWRFFELDFFSAADAAEALDVKPDDAGFRLNRLVSNGLIKKIVGKRSGKNEFFLYTFDFDKTRVDDDPDPVPFEK